MSGVRRRHSAGFKVKVVLEALKEEKTSAQLSGEYGVHPNQIARWKKKVLSELPGIFSGKRKESIREQEKSESELYRLRSDSSKRSWTGLKKNLNISVEEKRRLIKPGHPQIGVSRQCELPGLSRSGYYYKAEGESDYNEQLMRLIDEEYTRHPFYGSRRPAARLRRRGCNVNVKRIRRLMRIMGIEAVYRKPKLSGSSPEHEKYPYLLRGLRISRPNQVRSSDITYIRMKHGFIYPVAVTDRHSRYVLSHEISTSQETIFCLKALDTALKISTPEIFNTDQGSQFTSADFTGRLKDSGILISMDGRGRAPDNIFTERLRRSVKYEEVYPHSCENVKEARRGIGKYLEFYNEERFIRP